MNFNSSNRRKPPGPMVRLDFDVSERAMHQARKAGLSLDEWVNQIIDNHFVECNARDRVHLSFVPTARDGDDNIDT